MKNIFEAIKLLQKAKKVEYYKLKRLQKKKKLKPYIKMDKKIIKLDDAETEEYKFHKYKRPISINNINIS